MKNIKIAFIIGTRAELIKVFPLMIELQNKKIEYYFIHTGQHNLKDLCKKFGIKNPDEVLTAEPKRSSKFNSNQIKAIIWNLHLIFKIKRVLKRLKNLKYIIYHGDTMTTATAAIATSKILNPFKKYQNVHLEAGLRSCNIKEPFPEEISRIIADNYSDVLLVPSIIAKKNVDKKRNKKIILTGNTVLDSVEFAKKFYSKLKLKPLSNKKFVLITVHRHENIKSKKRMQKIIKILSNINVPAFFAMHDNTLHKIKSFGLYGELMKNKNINIIQPLDYLSFIYQMSKCSLIVCDGGSMQEESLIFKKPCIILRMNTERPEGLNTNFQFLSRLKVKETENKIKEYLSDNFKINSFNNPYGKIGVSKKIVDILK